MNNRMPYNVPHEVRDKVLRDAKELAYYTHVDELNCSKSFSRRPTKKTWEEILKIGFDSPHTLYNFIHRTAMFGEPEYYDVGLSTSTDISYFIWMKLTLLNGDALIDKYKLKERVYK